MKKLLNILLIVVLMAISFGAGMLTELTIMFGVPTVHWSAPTASVPTQITVETQKPVVLKKEASQTPTITATMTFTPTTTAQPTRNQAATATWTATPIIPPTRTASTTAVVCSLNDKQVVLAKGSIFKSEPEVEVLFNQYLKYDQAFELAVNERMIITLQREKPSQHRPVVFYNLTDETLVSTVDALLEEAMKKTIALSRNNEGETPYTHSNVSAIAIGPQMCANTKITNEQVAKIMLRGLGGPIEPIVIEITNDGLNVISLPEE